MTVYTVESFRYVRNYVLIPMDSGRIDWIDGSFGITQAGLRSTAATAAGWPSSSTSSTTIMAVSSHSRPGSATVSAYAPPAVSWF